MKPGFAIAIALLTLVVGVLGVATDTRHDTTKKLTIWGWIVVAILTGLGFTTIGSAVFDYQEELAEKDSIAHKYTQTVLFQDSIQRKTEFILNGLNSSVSQLDKLNGNLGKSTGEIQIVHQKSDSILENLGLSLVHQEELLNKTDTLHLNAVRAKYPLYPMEIVLVFEIDFEDIDIEHYDFVRDFKPYFDTVLVDNRDTSKYHITKKDGIVLAVESRPLKYIHQIDTSIFKGKKDSYVRSNFFPITAIHFCNKLIEPADSLIIEKNSKTHVVPMTLGDADDPIVFSYRVLPTAKKLQIIIRQKNIQNILSLRGTGSSIYDYYQEGVIAIRILRTKGSIPQYYNLRSVQLMCGSNREVSLDYGNSVIKTISINKEKAFLIKFNTNEPRQFSKSNYPFY